MTDTIINEVNLNDYPEKQDGVVKQTKKCKCCGRVLDVSEFRTYSKGYRNICKHCEYKNRGISEEFAKYEDKDLINELRSRGWSGKLEYKEIKIKTVEL